MIGRFLAAFLAVQTLSTVSTAQRQPPVRAQAPVGESGVLNGAPYRIDVPAGWNGGLVVLFHGYELPGEQRRLPYPALPGTDAFLQRGYAVIQSGYSRQGWAVAEARAETRALRALFERRFGRPSRAYAAGFSMGGHLALATVEQEHARYDGALSMCGVNMPATTLFDRAVGDLAAAAALFPGVFPDLAAPGSPASLDTAVFDRAIAAHPQAAARLTAHSGIKTEQLSFALSIFYAAVREMIGRAGGFPGSNASLRYSGFGDDAAFNRQVRRYTASPAARSYVRAHATLTGRLRDPAVLLNNIYDDLVSVQTQPIYPALVRRAGQSRRLIELPPSGNGHCDFRTAQVAAAFDRLRMQVEGRRPPR